MKKRFLPSAKAALVLVYLVIIAGALVRMTGSGMGCPDWPTCFGYYIPPTEEKELLYTTGKEYSKGQVIIKGETLLVAKDHFVAPKNFESSHWEKYTKHDYAIFNPFHLGRIPQPSSGCLSRNCLSNCLSFLFRFLERKETISFL